MDIKKIILDELKDKNWPDLMIARYIYIRTCELLTFNILYNLGSSDIREKLENRNIDINNLENNKVICRDWSHIYHDLLKEVGIDSRVEEMEKHMYVIVNIDNIQILADPTSKYYSDMVRAKYGDHTIGFIGYNVEITEPALRMLDEMIGYKKGIYTSEVIMMLKKELRDPDLLKQNLGITDDMSFYETLKIKFEFICSIINRSKKLNQGYVDTVNYMCYLMRNLLEVGECISVSEMVYYLENEQSLDIDAVSIYEIRVYDERYYYLLSKKEDLFKIEQIEEKEIEFYKKEYKIRRKMNTI